MLEGVHLYDDLQGNGAYYESVPLHVTVADYADDAHPHQGDEPDEVWAGPVDRYDFPRFWFDDGPTYRLKLSPSKDANGLYIDEGTIKVGERLWVELRTCEEVPADA